MTATRAAERPRATPWLLGGAFAAFTLWDFYLGPAGSGVRIFDLAALAACVAGLLVSEVLELPRRYRFVARRPDALLCFCGIFLVAGVAGTIQRTANVRPTLGVWIGVFLFVVFSTAQLSPDRVRRLLGWLLVVHAAALLVQLVVFYGSGVFVNFQAPVGGEPRVFSAIFRPSGLFLEPGQYALTAMLLLLLRARLVPQLDRVALLTLASVLLSVSLFGLIAVCAYLAYRYWRTIWFWGFVGVLALASVAWLEQLAALPQALALLDRVTNLGADNSVNARYGSLTEAGDQLWTAWHLWIGRGITNDYQGFGSSAISFVLTSVGALGSLLLGALLLALAARGTRAHVAFAVALGLVANPLWTTFFWWAWLGLLVNRSLVGAPVPVARRAYWPSSVPVGAGGAAVGSLS